MGKLRKSQLLFSQFSVENSQFFSCRARETSFNNNKNKPPSKMSFHSIFKSIFEFRNLIRNISSSKVILQHIIVIILKMYDTEPFKVGNLHQWPHVWSKPIRIQQLLQVNIQTTNSRQITINKPLLLLLKIHDYCFKYLCY